MAHRDICLRGKKLIAIGAYRTSFMAHKKA
jgi:hypothetical protein